jgi:peptidoglycan/LPS O-acetylase OafA/YrhL
MDGTGDRHQAGAKSRSGTPSGDEPGPSDRAAYRPDLDGFRAIAVGLVILTHARWPWVNNGGDAGVTAFFVLSGFLITNLLATQQDLHGRIAIAAFYRRRIVRLAPALLGVLAFTLLLGVVAGIQSDWQIGILSCLAYVSNWLQVGGLNIDPLGHTWSLAIEEQFYVIWPAVLILARRRAVQLAIAGIVVGSLIRIVATGLFEYFSTITRADAILVGCVFAIRQPRLPSGSGVVGLVVLVGVSLLNPSHDIAIPVAMAATAAVIGDRVSLLDGLAPLGLRAYSLYLWNWPMTLLFGSIGPLAPALTVLIGEVSFRLLEAPVLKGRGRGGREQRSQPAQQPGAA